MEHGKEGPVAERGSTSSGVEDQVTCFEMPSVLVGAKLSLAERYQWISPGKGNCSIAQTGANKGSYRITKWNERYSMYLLQIIKIRM